MIQKGRRQTAVVALLGLLVVSAPVTAAGRGSSPVKRPAGVAHGERAGEALSSRAWRWVRSLWEKDGMCIDPNGRCIESGAGSTPSQLDHGACIDPNGFGCAAFSSGG